MLIGFYPYLGFDVAPGRFLITSEDRSTPNHSTHGAPKYISPITYFNILTLYGWFLPCLYGKL